MQLPHTARTAATALLCAALLALPVLPAQDALAASAGKPSSQTAAPAQPQQKENAPMKKIVQTAGRTALGDFAPDFAHFNDDVLFGENWNNTDISLKTRSLITVIALMSSGVTDSSLKYHLENARKNGVTRKEIAASITHAAFYAGWPMAWAVFRMAKEVWTEDEPTNKE